MQAVLRVLFSIVTAAAVAPGVAAQDADARSALSVFEACAGISDAGHRHRCLDDALRTTGMVDEQALEEQARADYGRSAATIKRERNQYEVQNSGMASSTAEQRGFAARPAQLGQATSGSRDKARESLQTSIVTARLIGSHTLQVTTRGTGSWISTERQRFRRVPSEGDAFEIIPAALGGYRCRLEKSTVFACRRLD